jgi:hypothetical protein
MEKTPLFAETRKLSRVTRVRGLDDIKRFCYESSVLAAGAGSLGYKSYLAAARRCRWALKPAIKAPYVTCPQWLTHLMLSIAGKILSTLTPRSASIFWQSRNSTCILNRATADCHIAFYLEASTAVVEDKAVRPMRLLLRSRSADV